MLVRPGETALSKLRKHKAGGKTGMLPEFGGLWRCSFVGQAAGADTGCVERRGSDGLEGR